MSDDLWFDGETYDPRHDKVRLTGQILRVHQVVFDGRWRTLEEIQARTGDRDSLPAISARLRDFRKARFGAYEVQRRRRGSAKAGLFEYRLVVPPPVVVSQPKPYRPPVAVAML